MKSYTQHSTTMMEKDSNIYEIMWDTSKPNGTPLKCSMYQRAVH